MILPSSAAQTPFHCRVYNADTDFSGIVHHSAWMRLLEQARVEMLRARGVGQGGLSAVDGAPVAFTIRRYRLDFHRPARIDDRITIISRFSSVVRARFHLCQQAYCATVLLVDATLELALIDQQGRPRRPTTAQQMLSDPDIVSPEDD